MVDIFVSYRADDARYGAAGCYELLSSRFGSSRVFRDCVSLDPGQRYPEAIRQALEEMQVLVALIGPGWLAIDPGAAPGKRLIDRGHDWVRSEIRRAFVRGVPVIPVLLDGTTLPPREQLPADIADLTLRQAEHVQHRTFGSDIGRLADGIANSVPELMLPDLFVAAPCLPGNALPSMMLRAEYCVVPFAGREQEMARLTAWMQETDQLGVWLLTGPGGQGKTRLAGELVRQARDDRWAAGFVADRVADPVLARTGSVRAPLLLVVDYAEGRAEQLCEITTALATRPPGHGPVRILMLARSAGIWQRLLRPPDDRVALMFAELTAQPLASLIAPADRLAEFERALVAFAIQRGQPVPEHASPSDLGSAGYDRALDVHAAALAALLDASAGEPTPIRRDPVLRVLDHERRHWSSTAAPYDVPDPHALRLDQVVAAATLFGADGVTAARTLLTTLPTFDREGLDVVDRYRRWLAAVYPGAAALNPLRPDRLGEDLIAATLDEQAEMVAAVAAVLDEEQLTRALTVLGRAAPRHPNVGQAMTTLLDADPPNRIPVAMWVATQLPDGAALVEVLARVGDITDDVETQETILGNLPERSLALAAFAVVRTRAALEHTLRRSDSDLMEVARLRHDLSLRLDEIGEYDQALAAISQVVEYFRTEVSGGSRHLETDLAMALNTLASALSQLGFTEDGLESAAESIALLRQRYSASPKLRTYLATSLMNYGNLLSDLTRPTESVAALEEAVAFQLAEVRESDEDNLIDRLSRYAVGLDNLSTAYTSDGERPKALATVSEAVQIYRELDGVSSDEFRVDLLRGLGNLSAAHCEFDQLEEGHQAAEEAVRLARELVQRHGNVHLRRLADTLNNDAVVLRALGQDQQARDRMVEAVGIYRRLATVLPGAILAELADALHNLARSCFALQRFAEARDACDEAVDIYRKLAGPRPETAEPELADVLLARADLLHDQGEYEHARDDATEVVEIIERLVEQGRGDLRHELAGARHLLGLILTDQGQPREAAQVAARAADDYGALAASGCPELYPEWASALYAQARALDDAGLPADATVPFRMAVELLRMLEDDELSGALHSFALCLGALGYHEDALELVTEAVALRGEVLNEQKETRWDLAESLSNRADTLADLGRYDEALVEAGRAVKLFAGLLHDGHQEVGEAHTCALQVQARARESTGTW